MNKPSLTDAMLLRVEEELRRSIAPVRTPGQEDLNAMLAYHMGWEGEGAGPEAAGKRLRPLFVLLSVESAGGEWERALPAAAAVELIHNFSLIHDDIEDNSPTRRGRPTVWSKWGMAQAINAGDTMFILAHMALLRLDEIHSPGLTVKAARLLHETCLQLTQGQHLDISYEARQDLTLEDYWPMISGKTAALLSACTHLGALIAGADDRVIDLYREFGRSVGLAFQAQDDLLGIWGDSQVTGKSADSDLVSGKKSLPVLYGLAQNGQFARRWRQGPVLPEDVRSLAYQLEDEGARRFTQDHVQRLTDQALQALDSACPEEAGETLRRLVLRLVQRVV